MRQRRRYQPINHRDQPLSYDVLNKKGFCRRHDRSYPLNVVNNGRIECGKCPDCYPPNAKPTGATP